MIITGTYSQKFASSVVADNNAVRKKMVMMIKTEMVVAMRETKMMKVNKMTMKVNKMMMVGLTLTGFASQSSGCSSDFKCGVNSPA